MSKIEVLVVRDPDGPTDVRVFVDGVESTDYTEEVVDAGAGDVRSEWDAHTSWVAGRDELTPTFRTAVQIARENPPGSRYIEDDRTPPRDLVWDLHKDNDLLQLWEDYPRLSESEKDRLDYFACEQVSRLLVDKLIAAGWDAWLIHGTDPDTVDGMVGDHYWVGVDDDGMTEHLDATYLQFHNVADPQVALEVDAAAGEWPLQWHTYPESPRHQVVPYRTIKTVLD